MSRIVQTTEANVSIDRRLLPSNQKVVLSQRESAKLSASALGDELTDLGPGVLFTTEVTLSGITAVDQVVASITPGFVGRVVDVFALVSEPVTTAAKLATIDLFIDQNPGTNEVQSLALTGTPTGGTFVLDFPGMDLGDLTIDAEESGAIAYNAAPGAVQTALLAMDAFAPGDVVCTGSNLPTGPVTITFGGKYAGYNVPLFLDVAANATSLTGGTAETAAVTVSTEGATGGDSSGPEATDGGVIALTSANATPSGKVVPGSRVHDFSRLSSNRFGASSVLSFRTSAVTAFSEGKVLIGVVVAPDRKPGPADI